MSTQTEATAAPPATTLTDIALLIVRIGVGATLLDAGLRKFVSFGSTAAMMQQSGWRLPKLATFMISLAETAGGALLILGLLTPLAAFAVIAAMLDAWAVNVSAGQLWSQPFNHPFMLALSAAALLFAGAGSLSVDERLLGRLRWPTRGSVALLVLAIVVAVLTWVALNGTNPIHVG